MPRPSRCCPSHGGRGCQPTERPHASANRTSRDRIKRAQPGSRCALPSLRGGCRAKRVAAGLDDAPIGRARAAAGQTTRPVHRTIGRHGTLPRSRRAGAPTRSRAQRYMSPIRCSVRTFASLLPSRMTAAGRAQLMQSPGAARISGSPLVVGWRRRRRCARENLDHDE